MSADQQVDLTVIGGIVAARITVGGDDYPVAVNLKRWPYRWSADGETGYRLTLRGAVMAAAHSIVLTRARDRGTSRRRMARMRLTWGWLEIVEFGRRWMAREREVFPHFVEKPTGIR